MPRVSNKDGVAGPGMRNASAAPSRREFRMRGVRYEDAAGRLYVLPTQDDAAYLHQVELGNVDDGHYERELRRGLAFDPSREIRDLTARIMMYVQLPPPVGSVATRITQQRIQMPVPSASAQTRAESKLILKDIATGRYYEAEVQQVIAKRRAKRGTIILNHVTPLNL